ncbi:hypothetical protein [Dyadobacter sp.]|uniref:hypothetical protein n=1 Tax=Dyadobacter sp. TaxID=1914288 RepID=UPI0032671C5F
MYFWQNSLINANYKLELQLYFGGKKSPLKLSKYIFDFGPDQKEFFLPIEKMENQLVSDLEKDASYSPIDQMDQLLRDCFDPDWP